MRKYKKEEEQYFTEYDPSKFYGALDVDRCKNERYVMLPIKFKSDVFNMLTLQSDGNGIGIYSFKEACNQEIWQVFEFDTRKELLEWLLEEHK